MKFFRSLPGIRRQLILVSSCLFASTFLVHAKTPTVPTGLTASATSCSSVSLSWNASTENGGTVVGYKVYRNGSFVVQVVGTSYTDNGVVASSSYSYTVSAVDTAGRASTPRALPSFNTPAPPAPS